MQTKTYFIYEEDGEPMLHRAEGTDIQWKQGKNPTVKVPVIPQGLFVGLAEHTPLKTCLAVCSEVVGIGVHDLRCSA
jgi:hypothetical protein